MMCSVRAVTITIVCVLISWFGDRLVNGAAAQLHQPADVKQLKHWLKTTPNLLCVFISGAPDGVSEETRSVLNVITLAAEQVRGVASVVLVNCDSSEGRKICRKFKVTAESYLLKHYNHGVFNKDYDRRYTVSSLVSFLRDPAGEPPWQEDPSASHVQHLAHEQDLRQLVQRRPSHAILLLLYVPWCGHCRKLKPVFSSLATDIQKRTSQVTHVRQSVILAAIDLQRAGNSHLAARYDVTGYPTLLYLVNGEVKHRYNGANTRQALLDFLADPDSHVTTPSSSPASHEHVQPDWADEQNSSVFHLTDSSFDQFISSHSSVLVMFYAPWCGHCKSLKPHFENAATQMKSADISGVLAAVDATIHTVVSGRYSVEAYPTLRYFSSSAAEQSFVVTALRDHERIMQFMKDPRPPPPPPPAWHEDPSSLHVRHIKAEEGASEMRALLRRKKHALVMFHVPWCGHCQRTRPEFETAATRLADESRVLLLAVDCTIHAPICSAHDVTAYPTLVYFSHLKHSHHYSGPMTSDGFVSFIRNPPEFVSEKDEL